MANENNNEAKVIDKIATENENMVEISAKELSDLQESNANLITDCETLKVQVETLKVQVMAVEKKLTEKQESYNSVSRYWREAEDKLKTVCAALEVVDPSEYMTGRDFIKKIAGI